MRLTLFMAAGVITWAAHFLAIYGWTGYACERGLAATIPWVVGATTLVAVIVVVAVAVAGRSRRASFPHWLAAGLAAFALLGIVAEAISVLVVPACVSR
jgi:hypothetical protein